VYKIIATQTFLVPKTALHLSDILLTATVKINQV